MKKVTIALFTLVVLLASSCKKDSTGSATGVAGVMTADNYGFDGGSSGKYSSAATGIVQTTAGGFPTFTVSGIRDGGTESISIVLLKNITATGTIKIGPDLDNGGIIIRKDYQNVSDQTKSYSTDNSGGSTKGGGEIVITKLDGKIVEGTFYFVAFNSAGKEAFAENGAFKGTIN